MTPERSPNEAVEDLAAVKAEHRDILARVAADPGMAPETRWALIEHLYDEEDEHVAEIQAALKKAPASAPSAAARPDSAGRLTVGSLRQSPPEPTHRKGTVGSLRRS